MAMREYRCNNCGERFEELVSGSDPHVPCECPQCGVDDYHDPLISKCRFCFPDGLPSYQTFAEEDLSNGQ